ncbi:MAG: hypothetical protein WC150_13665 [Bacteroidia bacterium]
MSKKIVPKPKSGEKKKPDTEQEQKPSFGEVIQRIVRVKPMPLKKH